jgi:acetyltransferase-like isoleucine patch superfamily enzyme
MRFAAERVARVFKMLLEGLIRNISGRLGWYLRYKYYSSVMHSCGKNVRIDEGVIFYNPENVSLGSNVWISPYTIIIAKSRQEMLSPPNRILKIRRNDFFDGVIGEVVIGNNVSIGPYNYIQGWGGVVLRDGFTTSARVSIYSFSHHPNDEANPSKITYSNSMVGSSDVSCIQSPIICKENAWLGLNVIVLGGCVGKNVFVATNSVVLSTIDDNSYATGNPAIRVKQRFCDE